MAKLPTVLCGYCRRPFQGIASALEHIKPCRVYHPVDPSLAYVAAIADGRKAEAREIGMKPPVPMPDDVKELLRERQKSGVAKIRRIARETRALRKSRAR